MPYKPKACVVCGKTFAPKCSRAKYCADCRPKQKSAKLRAWCARNAEKVRELARVRYACNPEKVLAKNRAGARTRRVRNPEMIRAQDRARAARCFSGNPEKVRARKRAQQRTRRSRNPEKARVQQRTRYASNPEKFRAKSQVNRGRKRLRNLASFITDILTLAKELLHEQPADS